MKVLAADLDLRIVAPVGDDPKQRQPDITRARRYLRWEPTVQLEEGLLKTIEYFRAKL